MMNPAEFAFISECEETFWWFRGMRSILYALLDPIARGRSMRRVLEAGCGTGHMSRELARRYGWSLYPCDLDHEGLKYGREMGVPRLCQTDVSRLPYATASFDAVLSLDVIVHFPRGGEAAAMQEMARVLKPGGLMVLRTAALDILRSRHSAFTHERQRFTRERLTAAAAAAGIRPLRSTYANTFLLPVSLLKFRVIEPLTRARPASGVAPVPGWLNELLHAPLALEARCIAAGADLPAGQSLLLVGEKPA